MICGKRKLKRKNKKSDIRNKRISLMWYGVLKNMGPEFLFIHLIALYFKKQLNYY
jgi:hypothetical protein